MSNLTIVIPNYNGAHLLKRNLPSVMVAAQTYAADTEVIVVDDGSQDNSVAVLENDFPNIRLVRHLINQGFSEAILSGVKASTTDLVFLLNSDVEMQADCLKPLSEYFTDQTTFSVNPLMLDEDGEVIRHSWNLRSFQHGYLKLDDWNLDDARQLRRTQKLKSLYAIGGGMMVRKSMFMQLGGFHPLYKPFYGEDFDLGIRAWYKGWPTYFEPSVSVIHQSQGSIKDNHKRAKVKQVRRRNRYFLQWMHMSKTQLLLNSVPHSIFQLLGELILFDGKNIKGFFTALGGLPKVMAARREVMKNQVVNLQQVIEAIHDFK